MQSLLRWSVENSTPSTGPAPTTTNKLDPGIIDHILGKPDAQLMKEALSVGLDERQAEDDRLQALDDLEMLVQNIDNANDLKKLGIWEPLHGLLLAPNTTDALKMQTLWIIGTALQNNPAAQLAYLELDPLPTLLKSLSPTSNTAETRSRAVYALSGLLKLNAATVQQMGVVGGWSAFRMCLEDSEIRVRRKITFLLNTLLLPTSSPSSANLQSNMSLPSSNNAPVHANSHASMLSDPSSVSTCGITLAALQSANIEGGVGEGSLLDALISALTEPVPFGPDGENDKDDEFQENIVRILYTFVTSCGGTFSDAQKHCLWGFLGATTQAADDLNFGLTSGEWEELCGAVRS
ncbi:armadillo-type protein [Suillus lakei]|nr:armadillo-type protein [Suillus lakei]